MTHLTLKALFRNALLGLAAVLALPVVAPVAAFAGDAQGELQEIVVRVLPQPTVAGDNYTLGEVAEFDGFDVPAIAELAKVQLGRSPMPGRAAFLNEGFIRSRLTGSSLAERVRIEVPKGAQVLRAGQTVAAQDVE
ncbi:MAG TPA: hypothetical protein VF678_07430, partial [bacterium]